MLGFGLIIEPTCEHGMVFDLDVDSAVAVHGKCESLLIEVEDAGGRDALEE